MSRLPTKSVLDQYESAIDKIIAACDDDMRGALGALILANEQLEQSLERVSARLNAELEDCPPRGLLH